MAALRQKFVDQCKKYFGYPYARKYWPPDSPEYRSRLFLDCCGLVRQAMRDLADNFGFMIGPWNQAYMFDTLPITVETEEDMKPGDLVFISATYYNPKSKKQRHNMTHVEIWAGDGPKTIGARWNNGKVQIFNHYKFVAKSYYDETYHFKSIDTWLTGICESHCSNHRWKKSVYNPSKRSIFALQQTADEDQAEDQAAGDDDDNVEDFMVRGNSFCCTASTLSEIQASPLEASHPIQKARSAEEMQFERQIVEYKMGDSFEIVDESQQGYGTEMELTEIGTSADENDSDKMTAMRNVNLVDLHNRGLYLKEFVDLRIVENAEGKIKENDDGEEDIHFKVYVESSRDDNLEGNEADITKGKTSEAINPTDMDEKYDIETEKCILSTSEMIASENPEILGETVMPATMETDNNVVKLVDNENTNQNANPKVRQKKDKTSGNTDCISSRSILSTVSTASIADSQCSEDPPENSEGAC